MRRIEERGRAPDKFEDRARNEYDKVVAHRADPTKTKSFDFKVYKHKDLKNALHELFHGKCAYCETFYSATQPMDVEHFRPKGAVAEDDGHPGYWWLAMKWDNLLPSCIDCNRKRKQITPRGDVRQLTLVNETANAFSDQAVQNAGKKDSFPLAATGARASAQGPTARDDLAAAVSPGLAGEAALLLNPVADDPAQHLVHHFARVTGDQGRNLPPVSFLLAAPLDAVEPDTFRGEDDLSLKGATSIHVYGLNRLGLVQARTELLRRLEFMGTLTIQLHALADQIEDGPIPADPATAQLLAQAARALRGLADEITSELTQMSREDKPFSSMVQAWLDGFKGDLSV